MEKQNSRKPIGRRVEAKIEKVILGGDGLARMKDGAVLMTPFVLPDELVEVEIKQARKNLLRGEVVQFISTSHERVELRCRYFGRCGGCQYQHMNYSTQCKIKQEQVAETLSRLGKLADRRISEILQDLSPSPKPYGYRNRIVLHRNQRDGYGYFAVDNKTIIPIDKCPIANDEINSQLAHLSQLDSVPGQRELVLLGFGPEWVNVTKNEINVSLLDRVFTFGPKCFLQANISVFEDILRYVLGMLETMSAEVLVELYCGIGIISVLAADKFDKVLGSDINSNNIGYARRNLERYPNKKIRFSTADAAEALNNVKKRAVRPNTIILDPPRKGIDTDVVDGMKSLAPENIIYISCDPATFVRDVVRLSANYTLVSAKPFDMFPQTAHIELVGILERK